MKTYLCIGSNMENPLIQLEIALSKLLQINGLEVLRKSSIQKTSAYGYEDQDDFFNQVIECECNLSAEKLLEELKYIELTMGREQTFRWGPRLIDLDILLYGDLIIRTETLSVPHPDMHNRIFVMQLLDELVPSYMHPELGFTMHELHAKLNSLARR